MDSGNSGSLQSSSGGEEEYDSRSESISSFLNSSAHFGSISDPSQPPPLLSHHHLHQQPTTLFGHHHPHSQNLDAFQQSLPNHNANQFHNHDSMLWSRGLRSDPTGNHGNNNFGNTTALSSSSPSGLNHHSMPSSHSLDANAAAAAAKVSSAAVGGGGGQADHHHHHHQQTNAVKNPKKRTRASRRAPTTVLTTDTSNFRQMVQEFTGIPTAPFSAGSPYSRRLDLFSTGTSNLGPLYPLRPSAQKAHHHQLSPPSNTLLNSIDSANSGNSVMQSQNILNMQNQMLSFQGNNINNPNPNPSANPNPNPNPDPNSNNTNNSIPSFLQHPPPPSSMITGKPQGMMNNNAGLAPFDELGLGHHHHHHENVNVNSELWRDGGGGAAAAFNGGNKAPLPAHVSNYTKFNGTGAPGSDYLHHHQHQQHDKGLENGGEGTVGSWICPSD